MTCRDCSYFTDVMSSISAVKYQAGVGECRRYAPRGPMVLTTGTKTSIITPFPVVPVDDWCGEWKANE